MEAVADNRLKIENLTNVLLEAAQLIVSAKNKDDILYLVLEKVANALGCQRAYIYKKINKVTDKEGFKMVLKTQWKEASTDFDTLVDIPKEIEGADFFNSLYQIFNNNEISMSKAADLPEPERTILVNQGTAINVAVPIFIRQTLWGFYGLDVSFKSEKSFQNTSLDMLKTFAGILGNTIHNDEIRKKYKKNKREVERIQDLAGFSKFTINLKTNKVKIGKYFEKILGISESKRSYDMEELMAYIELESRLSYYAKIKREIEEKKDIDIIFPLRNINNDFYYLHFIIVYFFEL